MSGDRSLLELYAEYERLLAARRPDLSRRLVREVTGIRTLAELPQLKSDTMDENDVPQRLVLHPEPGIVLPALQWPEGDKQPVLFAPDSGMNAVVEKAVELNGKGHPVLVVEVRDTGETKTRNWRFPGADYYIAYMLGRSWLGMWAEDLLVSARWLAEQAGVDSVRLVARGEVVPAALHAAALEPALIRDVELLGGLKCWRDLMMETDTWTHLHSSVHGALKYYDLPDLKRLRAETP
jgi:hypothetical protein